MVKVGGVEFCLCLWCCAVEGVAVAEVVTGHIALAGLGECVSCWWACVMVRYRHSDGTIVRDQPDELIEFHTGLGRRLRADALLTLWWGCWVVMHRESLLCGVARQLISGNVKI